MVKGISIIAVCIGITGCGFNASEANDACTNHNGVRQIVISYKLSGPDHYVICKDGLAVNK